ncbi:MAG: hypothetical protein Q9200_002412 [Gallowayella weberi]
MDRLLKYVNGTRASQSRYLEQNDFVCAFIAEPILQTLATSPLITEQERQDVKNTISIGNEEATKEREDVGDEDSNPHEPNIPAAFIDEKILRPGPPKAQYEKQSNESASVTIYHGREMKDNTKLPGDLLRPYLSEPVGDPAIDKCYDMMVIARDFYRDYFGWDSVDDKGKPLVATVHYGTRLANAFWFSKENQMVYGDGSKLVRHFARSPEIVGHELAHGIIQYSSGLIYQYQSGALNESCADIMGSLLEQWLNQQSADEADWLLAQDVLLPDNPTVAMRSLKAPGTAYNDPRIGRDNQPAHVRDYVRTKHDNGGVHINSGIPNHAFYRAATRLRGNAWEAPGRTWFRAMTTAKPKSTFFEFAVLTIKEAEKEEAEHPGWKNIVIKAWIDVGVLKRKSASWYDRVWAWMGCGGRIMLDDDFMKISGIDSVEEIKY